MKYTPIKTIHIILVIVIISINSFMAGRYFHNKNENLDYLTAGLYYICSITYICLMMVELLDI